MTEIVITSIALIHLHEHLYINIDVGILYYFAIVANLIRLNILNKQKEMQVTNI